MYSMPVRTVWTLFDVARDAVAREDVAERRVLPARHEHRQVALGRGQQPAVLRIDLVVLLEHARPQDLVHELVREESLARLVRSLPLVEDGAFDAADGLVLGDARVGDAVQVLVEQLFLLLRREVRDSSGMRT